MAGELVHVCETKNATVRIYAGERTAAEREAALREAVVEFYGAVMKNPKTRGEWPND